MYYLCEKYYKPITVQYYIANCVSWVSGLTLLDLTNKLDLRTRSRNRTHSHVGDLLYYINLVDKAVPVFKRIDSSFERSSVGKMLSNSIAGYRGIIRERKSQLMWQASWLSHSKKLP